jgi:hypothetical protein
MLKKKVNKKFKKKSPGGIRTSDILIKIHAQTLLAGKRDWDVIVPEENVYIKLSSLQIF